MYEITVSPEDAGVRIDKFLSEKLPECTRSQIQKLIDGGFVTCGGCNSFRANAKTRAGQLITVEIPNAEQVEIKAENIPLDVVFEDEYLLVVNKAQGMVVHPAPGHYEGTLVNALLAHCGDSLSGINGEKRPGILHRIDKDTSGLLLVAKTDAAHRGLAKQISEHSLTRAYLALVHYNIKDDSGTICAPIGRDPADRKKMTVTYENSREAITHFNVLERFGQYTFIECVLETGRTHQIRVHMSKNGHPIVGDKTYGLKKEGFSTDGQLLHAYKIGFVHPISGAYLEFTAPLPDYFDRILKNLRKNVYNN